MSQPHVLAIDLGTSGPKAAVVSLDGRIVATGHERVATHFIPGSGVEQDPAEIWSAVKAASVRALRSSGAAAEVRAVICASQYSSIVPVDAAGRATMNMILWLDHRGETSRLKRLPGFPRAVDTPWRMLRWLRIHGLPPVEGGMSLAHMRWVRYARPDVYARTARFLEPMDYLALRFTGRAVATQCTAFMSLLTDNRTIGTTRYDPTLLRYSCIDRDRLPELVPVDSVVGEVLPDVATELGLPSGTVVAAGLNDTQAGGMGTAAFQGRHAAISIGSSAVMITHVPFKRTDVRRAVLSMPSPVPDTWFVMAENGTGGAALDHFLGRVLGASGAVDAPMMGDAYARIDRAVADMPAGSHGVLFLPWMTGSLAPCADRHMRGGFLNLGLDTTSDHMARAVMEGVAYNLRWLREAVERFARREFDSFTLYGGGAQSDTWSQIMADVLQAPVRQAQDPRYVTCRGAALLAFQRLGLLGFADFAPLIPTRREFEPDTSATSLHAHRHAQFVQAFRRNRPLFRMLNRQEGPA